MTTTAFTRTPIRTAAYRENAQLRARRTAAELTMIAVSLTIVILALDPSHRAALIPLAIPLGIGGIAYARALLR